MKLITKSFAVSLLLVTSALAQTPEQQKQIADAMNKAASAQADAMNQANAAMQQAQKQQAEANQQMNAALQSMTPEQRAQVEAQMKKSQEQAAAMQHTGH